MDIPSLTGFVKLTNSKVKVGSSASYGCSTEGYVTDNGAKQLLTCRDDGSFDTRYSCNKITKTWIQISLQDQIGFFLNIIHLRMIWQILIVSTSKTKWYKQQKNKKLTLNSLCTTNLSNFDNDHFLSFLFYYYCMLYVVWCHNRQAFNLVIPCISKWTNPRIKEKFRFLLEYVPPIWNYKYYYKSHLLIWAIIERKSSSARKRIQKI